MDETPPLTAQRVAYALFAAVAIATAAKAGLVLVLPHLLQSSLSAMTGNLFDAQAHWEMLKPLALLRGAVGAILCLVPALLLARRWNAALPGYVAAGAVGEFVHNGLSALLLEPALTALERNTVFLFNLRPETLVLQGDAAVALASVVAGALAGAVFAHRVLPREWGKPALYWRPVFLVPSAGALLLGWFVFHDREGDALCRHTDVVRLSVDGTVFRLPAVMQPKIEALDPKKPPHVFLAAHHVYSNAAETAQYRSVYCQTDEEPAWAIRGFTVNSKQVATPARLPDGVSWISLYNAASATPAPPPASVTALHPPASSGLELLEPVIAYGIAFPGGKSGAIGIRLRDGTLLNAELNFDFTDPDAALPSYRKLAEFLKAYRLPIRP
jgi:hypothetical protein